MLKEMIENQNEKFKELKRENKINYNTGKAFICGTFTNWEPRRMLQIDELCAYLQNKGDELST